MHGLHIGNARRWEFLVAGKQEDKKTRLFLEKTFSPLSCFLLLFLFLRRSSHSDLKDRTPRAYFYCCSFSSGLCDSEIILYCNSAAKKWWWRSSDDRDCHTRRNSNSATVTPSSTTCTKRGSGKMMQRSKNQQRRKRRKKRRKKRQEEQRRSKDLRFALLGLFGRIRSGECTSRARWRNRSITRCRYPRSFCAVLFASRFGHHIGKMYRSDATSCDNRRGNLPPLSRKHAAVFARG